VSFCHADSAVAGLCSAYILPLSILIFWLEQGMIFYGGGDLDRKIGASADDLFSSHGRKTLRYMHSSTVERKSLILGLQAGFLYRQISRMVRFESW
jgi:hypothetical protein